MVPLYVWVAAIPLSFPIGYYSTLALMSVIDAVKPRSER